MITSIQEGLSSIEKTNSDTIRDYRIKIDEYNELVTKLENGIKKHHGIRSKAIFNSARIGLKCCKNVDAKFTDIFPNDETIPSLIRQNPFNPRLIFDFSSETGQYIEHWDHETGILPETRVIDTYYVNFNDNNIYYCKKTKKVFTESTKPEGEHIYKYDVSFESEDPEITDLISLKFEVDNYLNLYEPKSGIYIVLNKIPFPESVLKFRSMKYRSREMTNLDKSKLTYNHVSNIIESLKSGDEDYVYEYALDMIARIRNYIPSNYEDVYNYYNAYRESPYFKCESMKEEESDDDSEDGVKIYPETILDEEPFPELSESEDEEEPEYLKQRLPEFEVIDHLSWYNQWGKVTKEFMDVMKNKEDDIDFYDIEPDFYYEFMKEEFA